MITRYTPFARLRDIDRFGKMMDEMFGGASDEVRGTWMPAVDIKETAEALKFVAELPGMDEEKIEVELVGDVLTIRGEREFAKEENREDYVRIERSYGSFQRSFTIDIPVDREKVEASYEHGVLTVLVPKAPGVVGRKVPINKQATS
ncbi:MAG: Hsp20/alpha crystallin family protein [Fimbriimonadaceae bacterium]|nr:Hsp20/alpha crystallin family protein [Fimbriimonadaceae bacterium]